jgi:hypothetical protein
MTTASVVIERRFRGPDRSGHGGYTCGLVGAAAGNPAEVRLERPPPLDEPLSVRRLGDTWVLVAWDDTVVAEARAVDDLGIEVPSPPVLHAAAQEGAEAYLAATEGTHPFPECFGCGPHRAERDGLRIFAGAVPGRDGIFASPWIPDETLAGTGSDEVRDEITWAALDCPTGTPVLFDLPADTAIVLGTMAAHLHSRPRVGYRYVVMSWLESRSERSARGCAALLGERGDPVATARGIWVFVDRDRFEGS